MGAKVFCFERVADKTDTVVRTPEIYLYQNNV
jgi:hypothetical protein